MSSRSDDTPAAGAVPRVVRPLGVAAQQNALVMRRRRRTSFFVVPPAAVEEGQRPMTSMLQEVTRTHTVLETEVAEGISQFELHSDGKVVGPGLGSNLADALVGFAIELEAGEDSDLPDN